MENFNNLMALLLFIFGIMTVIWPMFYETFNYDKDQFRINCKLRAIKMFKNDDTFFFIVQQKLYFTNWFRFYGKWYGISEDSSGFSKITEYDTLEDAENRIKKLVKKSNDYNEKKYNNTIKNKEIVIITK